MNIDELRRGLAELAAEVDVDTGDGRAAVAARVRRGRRPRAAVRLAAAAVLALLVGAVAVLVGHSEPARVHVTGRPPTAPTVPVTTTPPVTTAPPLTLVAGPYGFLVPQGWSERPLQNFGGPLSTATFTSPDGRSRIDYGINGGSFGATYHADHTPDMTGVRSVWITCAAPTIVGTGPSSLAYTCAGARGVILVRPYPEGSKRLEVVLPSADRAYANAILASFR